MKKEVIILVGPMGSGKTTLCNTKYKKYFRISQDDQGRSAHLENYKQALENNEPLIIIDRINHLFAKRKQYIDLARNHDYKTRIIVLNEEFETCFNRVKLRREHPNLNQNTDDSIILKALRMYFKEYQMPLLSEADKIEKLTDYDPYMLDLSKKYDNFLIIGDIHGCFDELKELLDKVKDKIDSSTAIIFIGDLIDKGPKNKEVIDLFNSLNNAYTILGNHEFKLKRYLRGNNVTINYGLDKTIEQMNLFDLEAKHVKDFLFELESIPYCIKLSNNDFVVHAGINPLKSIYTQNKDNFLFTRTFNPKTYEFSNDDDKFWFEYLDEKRENIYFGHQFQKEIQVRENAFALDGYCVYGKELRAILLKKNKNKFDKEIFIVPSKQVYYESKKEVDGVTNDQSNLEPFEKLVSEKFIKKVETKDLILYNYTDKTTFERNWNQYTLQARGLIYNKKTHKIVARPFNKFFNLGENEDSLLHNLPKLEKYECFEKLDGSLGIMYWFNDKFNVATRGSFESIQAKKAEEILKNYNLEKLNKEYTYLVEIIYPENKIVVEYTDEKLVLLGARHTINGDELTYEELKVISKETKIELVQKFDYSIEDMIKLQKTLSKDNEGFVIKFENDLRIKIKGDEYLKIAKILSQVSPLSLWEVMENGEVSKSYLEQIPEEIFPEIKPIVDELEKQYNFMKDKIYDEFNSIPINLNQNLEILRKELGKHVFDKKVNYNHTPSFFPILLRNKKAIDKYILSQIRPDGNELR